MITLDEAKQLQYGDILIDDRNRRWKVSGKVQTWKRDANRVRVPLKHGLYSYDSLNTSDFNMQGECPFMTKEVRT
jgi:hypothetical protein